MTVGLIKAHFSAVLQFNTKEVKDFEYYKRSKLPLPPKAHTAHYRRTELALCCYPS